MEGGGASVVSDLRYNFNQVKVEKGYREAVEGDKPGYWIPKALK